MLRIRDGGQRVNTGNMYSCVPVVTRTAYVGVRIRYGVRTTVRDGAGIFVYVYTALQPLCDMARRGGVREPASPMRCPGARQRAARQRQRSGPGGGAPPRTPPARTVHQGGKPRFAPNDSRERLHTRHRASMTSHPHVRSALCRARTSCTPQRLYCRCVQSTSWHLMWSPSAAAPHVHKWKQAHRAIRAAARWGSPRCVRTSRASLGAPAQ